MEQIESTGLVLSEKNNLVQIPIGSNGKINYLVTAILDFRSTQK
jgi:hypothetical protein